MSGLYSEYTYYDDILYFKKMSYKQYTYKLYSIEYHRGGGFHRTNDKPACVYFDDNGDKISEFYAFKGYYHRENFKPAVIHYEPKTGFVTAEEYWIDGYCFEEEEIILKRTLYTRKKILKKLLK